MHVTKITYDLIVGTETIKETVVPSDFGLTEWAFPTSRSAGMESDLAYHSLANYVVRFAGFEDEYWSTKFTFWTTEDEEASISNVNLVFGDNTYTIDNIYNWYTYEIAALWEEPAYLNEYSRTVKKWSTTKTFRLTKTNNLSKLKIWDERIRVFWTN